MTVPYEEWMRPASLILSEEASGCVNCGHVLDEYALLAPVLPDPVVFVPDYRITYITPPVEPVKERSDSYVCRINYVVDKWDLLRDFKDNARILDEVDKVITEIKNDPNLTITSCSVTGYASPEGRYERNVILAENRARTFMDYLRERHGWDMSTVSSEGRAEDWEGLRAAVAASPLIGRQIVLDIIDNRTGTERKTAMQALPSYRSVLLPEYYAPLRRNEYRVSYTVRGFSMEEAKELLKTRPQLLSLNELFMVANSYPNGSEEYKYAFDVAARMFPQDATANLNAGAVEIETGAYDAAIARLGRLSTPEAWNDLGVAYAKQGNTAAAEANFRKAAAAGSADAAHNLEQLQRLKND
jgi:tetratricopeptide (TPR) repeat protein